MEKGGSLQIVRIKLKKINGEDEIRNKVWKNTVENIVDEITEIFNKICGGEGFAES